MLAMPTEPGRRFLAPWQVPSKSNGRAHPIIASHGQRHRFNLFNPFNP